MTFTNIIIMYLQGKPYTSIEGETELNNLCLIPDSGMLFMATEAPKILSYYIPVRWLIMKNSKTQKILSYYIPVRWLIKKLK